MLQPHPPRPDRTPVIPDPTPETRAPEPAPAWTDDDLSQDPHAAADKAQRVEAMFAAIARRYDLNNRLHSMWRDQAWRRAAVRMAQVKPTDVVLDVACGTGDLTFAFAHELRQLNAAETFDVGQVMGLDFTHEMLQIAKHKSHSCAWPNQCMKPGLKVNPARYSTSVPFIRGDAMRLPVTDTSADVLSIAFGIRNVVKPQAALEEFYRVLRPGGRVILLEFSQPTNPLIRGLDKFYREKIMPRTATLIARDKSGAYKYLPKSVSTFLSREQMTANIESAGFTGVAHKVLTLGIAVCYRGVKP